VKVKVTGEKERDDASMMTPSNENEWKLRYCRSQRLLTIEIKYKTTILSKIRIVFMIMLVLGSKFQCRREPK